MFCPKCESEYREGYTRCEACEVDLVPERPAHEDPELTAVLRTNNQPLLLAFQSALNGAEIPHFVRGGEAASLMPTNAVVVVPAKYAEAAREILREAESAL